MKKEAVIMNSMAIGAMAIYSILRGIYSKDDQVVLESQDESSNDSKGAPQDELSSTVYIPKKEGEYIESYDLERFRRDSYQVGYELENLISDRFYDLLENGVDYMRFNGVYTPKSDYCEIKFHGRSKATITLFGSEAYEKVEQSFWKEYLSEVKSDGARASFVEPREPIKVIKGTYNSFADLVYKPTEEISDLVVSKILLSRARMEDFIYTMVWLKKLGITIILMY